MANINSIGYGIQDLTITTLFQAKMSNTEYKEQNMQICLT